MAHHGSCCHNHNCEDNECSSDWSLYQNVDLPKVRALNEAVEGSAQQVFKAWEERLDIEGTVLESNDDDCELLVFVPFTSDVKIKSISVIGGPEGSSPARMRAFLNREDIDFSNVHDLSPVQEWTLADNSSGDLEYPTRYSRFQGVANIVLHFPDNFGADTTRIHFIGFKGEATQLTRDRVVNVVYEAMPRPQDHKVKDQTQSTTHVID